MPPKRQQQRPSGDKIVPLEPTESTDPNIVHDPGLVYEGELSTVDEAPGEDDDTLNEEDPKEGPPVAPLDFCSSPTICFPYPLSPDTYHVQCVHGERFFEEGLS